jgi:hypothetical protein
MSRRTIFIILAACIVTSALARPAHAAKPRLRRGTPAAAGPAVRGISFSTARLSRATRSVVVTFLNLDKAAKVSYELTYTTNGIPQGAIGTVAGGGSSDTRDLYFGTCSKGVCTPHYNITGARLVVRTTTTTGGVNTKLYRIKM